MVILESQRKVYLLVVLLLHRVLCVLGYQIFLGIQHLALPYLRKAETTKWP